MSRQLEEVFSFIGTRRGKRNRKERLLFNADLLDQKREDVFAVMYMMGMYR